MTHDNLEQALKERDRLTRAYRASKRAQYEKAFEQEPRLRAFDRAINRCTAADAETMISICRVYQAGWLRNASPEIRALALEIVSRRIVRIREGAGLASFDDALPWEADDVFQQVKRILT